MQTSETMNARCLHRLAVLVCALLCCVALLTHGRAARADTVVDHVRNQGPGEMELEYHVVLAVNVTTDADGWNDASVTFNYTYENGAVSPEGPRGVTQSGEGALQDKFDNEREFTVEAYSKNFPSSVRIYTDFGGGMTWRSFEADVTLKVNDLDIASKHIACKSSAWSSSDTTHTIEVDSSKYPYPTQVYVQADETVVGEPGGDAGCSVAVSAIDQYGVRHPNDIMYLSDDQGAQIAGHIPEWDQVRCAFDVSCAGPNDKSVRYTLRLPTANDSVGDVCTDFVIAYRFPRTARVMYDGRELATLTGFNGEEVALDYPEVVEPGYAVEWNLEGGGSVQSQGREVATYRFGDADATLTAARTAYSYSLVLDGNGATGGSMVTRVIKVGTTEMLPQNVYVRTGYTFTGWNTVADGSGQRYENKASFKDLSTTNNDVVTLYAQWEPKMFTVTFINRATGQRETQEVPYGGAATAPDAPAFVSINATRHNAFVSWNRAYDKILRPTTITATYRAGLHRFEEQDGVKRCADCGYTEGGAGAAGSVASVFGTGSTTAIVACVCCAAAAAAVVIVRKARRKDEASS